LDEVWHWFGDGSQTFGFGWMS